MLVATDKRDEGVSPLIDMTKVTSSTLADKTLPQPRDGAVQRSLEQGSAAINQACGGATSGKKNHTKGKKWDAQHVKAVCSGGKLFGLFCRASKASPNKAEEDRPLVDLFVELEPVFSSCPFSFSFLWLVCASW